MCYNQCGYLEIKRRRVTAVRNLRYFMFSVNEYVIYGSEGVCKVESIGHPDIAGLDREKEYYTLSPVYRCGKIYTPVNSPIIMRRVISRNQAEELIGGIKDISGDLDVPKDAKLANVFYRELVRTYECSKLISVIKHVFNKQRAFAEIKKNVPAVDMKFFKMAEDMLYGEFGFVLGIDPKEVKSYIASCCERV